MNKYRYECTLYGKKYYGEIDAVNRLRAIENLLRKYDKVDQLIYLHKL